MAKRKLTTQQQRRLQEKRSKTSVDQVNQSASNLLGAEQEGLVITSFGKRVLVEDRHGETFNCAIRQHLGKLVAGDKVIWQTDVEENTGVVVSILPRSSELSRPGFRGQKRMIAANVDFIGIVTPVVPGIHPDMIDRYLVASQQLNIPAVIIINKTDLLKSDDDWENVAALLEPYDELDIEIIPASSVTKDGLEDLLEFMSGKNSVLVGPSGAGKSSLINALIPDIDIRVGQLSEATGLGKHTTTNSILYHLPDNEALGFTGGNLIDSPGVRQFSPAPCELAELEQYYADFSPYLGHCKFSNCTHTNEPKCAIKQAVEDGMISYTRYQSFQRLLKEFQEAENGI